MNKRMFDRGVICKSISDFKKTVDRAGGIPCRICLVRTTCYEEFELEDDIAGFKIYNSCDEFNKWCEKAL